MPSEWNFRVVWPKKHFEVQISTVDGHLYEQVILKEMVWLKKQEAQDTCGNCQPY